MILVMMYAVVYSGRVCKLLETSFKSVSPILNVDGLETQVMRLSVLKHCQSFPKLTLSLNFSYAITKAPIFLS